MSAEKLSIEEKEAIKELKRRTMRELTPKLLEDETLFYRFLKARDFNLKKAEALLRKHLSDRKIYRVEDILHGSYTPPEHMSTYYPICVLGFDKEGSIVRYVDIGGLDHRAIVCMFSLKQIVQYSINFLEQDFLSLREQSRKLGKPVTKMSYIMNMDKLDIYKATFKKGIEMMVEGFQIYQDNYPERIKSIYIINASVYFSIAFSVIKTILAAPLLEKITIFGKQNWKEALLKDIDADVIPTFLGGNRTDPDGNPMCKSFVVHAGPIPEELYINKKKKILAEEIGVKQLVVTRFAASQLDFEVNEPNTQIEWEFASKTSDIGFGLFYRNKCMSNNDQEELIPIHRINTTLISETGVYKCLKTGTYIIVFDNSYSWIRAKEIYYKIVVVKPIENIYEIS